MTNKTPNKVADAIYTLIFSLALAGISFYVLAVGSEAVATLRAAIR